MEEKVEKVKEKERINWIGHLEWLVLFIAVVGSIYNLNSRFDAFMIATHVESKDFHGRMERIEAEYKAKHERHEAEFADVKSQSARTDRLYEMFIELVKEGRK